MQKSLRNTPTEENWIDVSDEIALLAFEYGVESEVVIMTIPNDGATIKYQTEGQRERNLSPLTAKQLTPCTEIMPIGIYYVWSERNEKPTCDLDNQYLITEVRQEVQIHEEVDNP